MSNFVPIVRGREMILYPANFPESAKLTFESAEDAKQYRECYYLGLYVSSFGDGVAPHGVDDCGIALLHPDDPKINPFFGMKSRKKAKKKRGRR